MIYGKKQKPLDKIIDKEVIGKGICDASVIEALRNIPRERFISEPLHDFNFISSPLPIGHNQTISSIYTVALMTESLKLKKEHKVLEIGTGSGYQAAILSKLVSSVFTIERIRELSLKARVNLESLGIQNIIFIIGDGSIGYKEYSPFDRIIVTACAPDFPEPLFDQLAEGGIMVLPIETETGQNIFSIEKKNGKIVSNLISTANFVKLIGKNGY